MICGGGVGLRGPQECEKIDVPLQGAVRTLAGGPKGKLHVCVTKPKSISGSPACCLCEFTKRAWMHLLVADKWAQHKWGRCKSNECMIKPSRGDSQMPIELEALAESRELFSWSPSSKGLAEYC